MIGWIRSLGKESIFKDFSQNGRRLDDTAEYYSTATLDTAGKDSY